MTDTEKILDAKSAFTVAETDLRPRLGLTKDEIRSVRKGKLQEGEHWLQIGKHICYSAQGIQELHRVLKLPDAAKNADALPGLNAERGAPVKPEIITLKVLRSGLKNSRVIEAYYPTHDPADPENRMTVRVRNPRHFIPGMEIPVFKLRDRLYELARACPRTKGKW